MKLTRTFLTLNFVLFCVSGCNFCFKIDLNSKPCPCDEKPIEPDETEKLLINIDLDHAFQPDQKVVLKNGIAAVKLCQSNDGSIEIYKCVTKKFGERGIIVRYWFENYNNVYYLDEICLRNTAKIFRLKNGDVLLSLLQGVDKSVYVNKLFVIHISNDGRLIPFEVKIDEIFKQIKEKTEFNLSFEKKVVTVNDPVNHQALSFFLTDTVKSIMNSKDFDRGQWTPDYSPSILSYIFQEQPKILLRIALINEKKHAEHFLGEVSFDFDYNIVCRCGEQEFSFDLNNLEIVKQM